MGVVFLLLVGVDPAGLPPSDSPTFRANYIKSCLNAVGLELSDSQYDERPRASSCVRFLGNPSGNNFFNIEVMLNVNTARQQAAFYALVNGRTKLLMEADVVPIDVAWIYQGKSCTPKVKLSNYGLSMWMSFHHMVLGLSPRACVAAFLKWFIEKVRAFETRPATRGLLINGDSEAVSNKIAGIDFISSHRADQPL